MWSIARWVLALVLVLLLAAAGWGVWAVRRPFPQVDGELTLAGLDAPVTVLRDEWGVPHLYGDSTTDLVMAQGWVHAQDRFWEMDVRRHLTAGRLAELFGEAQLDTDRFLRTMGWRRVAAQEYDLLTDESRAVLDAYAAGVNAYIDGRSPGELSLEYTVLGLTGTDVTIEPWTPVDTLAWLKAMAYDLRANSDEEIERVRLTTALGAERAAVLDPAYPYDEVAPIVADDVVAETLSATLGSAAGDGLGSNSWAVSGELTASGGAMLANDPHLSPSQPGIWHQVGLHCTTVDDDCPLTVSGFGFSGVPGVIIGRNADVAWGFTNLAADVQDHYVERVDGDRYEVDGELVDMDVREEVIEVAGGASVTHVVRRTRHGPVLSDVSEALTELLDVGRFPGLDLAADRDHAISLRWTALDPGRTFDALLALNTARDVEDFRAAAEVYEVPAQNLLYADAEGNIAYQAPGRHPIRAEGHDGTVPVAGWTTATDWQGFIPFEDLPFVLNPDEGMIVTANQAVVGPDFTHDWPGEWAPGFRAAVIERRLEEAVADGSTDLAEVAAIQLEDDLGLVPILRDALLAVPLEGHAAQARALLEDWDGSMAVDSAAAAYMAGVQRHLLLGTFADELPEEVEVGDRGGWWLVLDELLDRPDDPFWDDVTTDEVEDRDAMLVAALTAADAELVELLGEDVEDWAWGDLHQLELRHGTLGESGIAPVEALFNRGPLPTAGAGSVVNATGWDLVEGYDVSWVPSMRMAVDLARPDDARWISLTGVSGHAFHPHYADMAPAWARGETVRWPLTPSAVAASAVDELVLRP